MEKMMSYFENKMKLLKEIDKVYFRFGIFEEDGTREVNYIIYDLDGNKVGNERTTLRDVMYYTEKGTISIPPYRVLERISGLMKETISPYIKEIIDKLMEDGGSIEDIRKGFEKYTDYVNMHIIPSVIDEIITEQNRMTNLLNDSKNASVKAVYDLKSLKSFIKCKFFIEN